MRRLLAVGLVVMLLAGSLPAFGSQSTTATKQTITTSQEFDNVEFRIVVYDNSSARWTFHYERTLENDSERQQFRQFAKQFNSSSTPLYTNFKENAVGLTSNAANQTGRVMRAENFSKNARLEGVGVEKNLGVVEMSFKWTSFTYMGDNGHVAIGDVFQDGLYLGQNQTLVVEPGKKGMTFTSAKPAQGRNMTGDTLAESDSVSWSGEQKFNDQRPLVKFKAPNQNVSATTTTTSSGTTPPGQNGEEPTSDSPMMLFVAAVVVIVGLAAAFAWRQGGLGGLSTDDEGPDAGPGGPPPTQPESGGSTGGEPAVSDEELLTDEARVKKLLHDNGGRMKQVNIVEETGWSKSKVSMLLSEMEDEGDISKLRVGRENIISLDGHEPDAAGSPLDE
ncbi:helix-turn-helix transcriptional regulator [Halomicrococcus sp. SG-WS-1]|uniref:helix-turn-helix transcriptional regulator n=1 Tax=Halomicrococcus sp. SG-WS-1 TaxID=3439057 RepID=UPI003F78FF1B